MEPSEKIFKLQGKIFHYAWGGYEFLPGLLGIDNPKHEPFAEYWMGAHPLAPSQLLTTSGSVSLADMIRQDPQRVLSAEVAGRFGELPYLFKLQDVKDILSIQVHPSKEEAEKGFDLEEKAGIPRDAPNRNYKDRNHKPEVMVALSEFWLLHGFRSQEEIETILNDVPEFNVLIPYFRQDGLQALYRFIMEMPQVDVNFMLEDLVKREIRRKRESELTKEMPGWWVARLYDTPAFDGNIDRATFSIYLFNIVKVNPGEGVFQGAGIPHAYMEGQTVELMANSDNVLRGGLTPKHIDVPELLKQVSFESVTPNVMKGEERLPGETVYPCPVPDFGIARIELEGGMRYENRSRSLEILVVTEGGILINNLMVLKKGEAAAILADTDYSIDASGHAVVFRAFVPVS